MNSISSSLRLVALTVLVAPVLTGCDDRRAPERTTTNSDAARPTTSDTPSTANTNADNTAVNTRDRDTSRPTPVNQSESAEDIRITAEIRKAVLSIDGLSINGQNVKIITQAGKVTLRGPVASDAERTAIAEKAKAVAGVTSVVNELEVQRL